ncbi:MAG: hypothetical protein V7785_00930 [Bermanella sp.]
MKYFAPLLLMVMLTACVPFATKPSAITPDIQDHEKQLQINPKNPGSLAALGERYFKLFEETKWTKHRDTSIKYNQAYLDLYPQHPGVKRNLYLAYFHKVSHDFNQESANKLSAIFNSVNTVNALSLNPPSIAIYNYKVKHNPQIEKLIELLKQAVVEQPASAFAYLKLARAYGSRGQKKMAQAILLYGSQNNPDNLYLQVSLGDSYMARGKEKVCQGDQYNDLEKALSFYHKVLKVRPESARLRAEMAEAYFYNGRFRLALAQYKKSQEFSKDNMKLLDIGIVYSILGKNDKALDYFQRAGDGYFAVKDLAVHYFSLEQWGESLTSYQQEFTLQDEHFYSRLLESYAMSFNDANNPGVEKLMQFVVNHELSSWEKKLYKLRLKQISSDALMVDANDACQRTEGYFYRALQARLSGNKELYQQLLDKTLQEKIYLFTEYKAAKNLARQARL